MNALDLAVIALIVLSALFAVVRGFVREVLAVAAWVGAALVALYGFQPLRPVAHEFIGEGLIADAVLAVALFIVALIVFSLVTHAIASRVQQSRLSAVDRSLGLLFGIARGAFLVCLGYLLFTWAVPTAEHPPWVREARALPLIQRGADWLESLIPPEMRARTASETRRRTDDVRDAERTFRALSDPPARSSPPAGGRSGYGAGERRDLDRLIRQSGD